MDRYVMMYRDADVEGIFMCEDQGCVRRSAGGGCLLGLHARFSVKRLTGERVVGGPVEIFHSTAFSQLRNCDWF